MWLAITIAMVIVVLATVTGCQPFDIKNSGEKLGIIFINITHTETYLCIIIVGLATVIVAIVIVLSIIYEYNRDDVW